MGKHSGAVSALLLLVACSTTTAPQATAIRLSPEETVAYLQTRLVGWAANDGDGWVRYDSVTLTDCLLVISQSRSTDSGIHTLHHEYPLNLPGDAEWYANLGSSGVLMVAGSEGAVIRLRWNREASSRNLKVDQLELPAEHGDPIVKAFNHLRRTCVPVPDKDPFR